MRDDIALLEEHEKSPPSFCVQLYPDYWMLNSGPKFTYNNPMSSLLDDIRALRIPTDFIPIFDDANMPYYNGCLLVEILDFRPAKAKDPILERPDRQRVVLRPNAETLWADICILDAKSGAKWTDTDALQVESKLLLATSTPLCLDPDPSLSRIVNSILRVSTPNVPKSLRRKAAAMVDLEEDETEKAKRAKIMQFMNPQFNPSRKPIVRNYKILTALEQRGGKQQAHQAQSSSMPPAAHPSAGTMAPQNISTQQAPDKAPATIIPQLTTIYSQPNGAPHQPIPLSIPQLQHAIDPSHRLSPSKQQQVASTAAPQRPPSRPPTAARINSSAQQPQAQAQEQQTQPIAFNPPLPPSNFLNPPPTSRRRPSVTFNPATPVAPTAPLPTHQPMSQTHPQVQPQPQTQTQTQPQMQQQVQQQTHQQAQQQTQPQTRQAAPTPRPPSQPQRIPPLVPAPQARPVQIPANLSSLQAMRNAQFYLGAGGIPMPMPQTAATVAAIQRQNMNGRITPLSRANSTASPAPPSTGMTHSPMIPAAVMAAMMSRQNTPAATNTQVARESPLSGNHPAVGRAVAVQNTPQQQPQATMQGTEPVMIQPGIAANPAFPYQHYQQQRLQAVQAAYLRQAQLNQQSHMVAAAQHQHQQQQQAGNAQPQQATQDQSAGAQPPFVGVVPNQQAFNYMTMGMNQPYVWTQGGAGRGMTRVGPNGQPIPVMPQSMSMQQMQALGRGGGMPNR